MELGCDQVGLLGQRVLPLTEPAALVLLGRSLVVEAVAPEGSDLLRQRVDLGADVVTLADQLALAGIEGASPFEVDEQRRVVAARQPGEHVVVVGSQSSHVEHDPRS